MVYTCIIERHVTCTLAYHKESFSSSMKHFIYSNVVIINFRVMLIFRPLCNND